MTPTKKRVRLIAATALALWIGQAVLIVLCAHARLRVVYFKHRDTNPQVAERERLTLLNLNLVKSATPLLRKPLRPDVRIYYGQFAWASNETGQWDVKIH